MRPSLGLWADFSREEANAPAEIRGRIILWGVDFSLCQLACPTLMGRQNWPP